MPVHTAVSLNTPWDEAVKHTRDNYEINIFFNWLIQQEEIVS